MRPDLNTFLYYFCSVADQKSFTKAAQELGLSPSALSQAIQQLEQKLAVRLLHRTTRAIALTEAGQILYARIQPTLEEITAALEEIKQLQHNPSGIIKITTSYIAWKKILYPKIACFTKQYPYIQLDIQINDGLNDIILEGFDIGIRSTQVLNETMIAVPLNNYIDSAIVASAEYLQKHTPPSQPEDIYQHICIGYRYTTSQQLHTWHFTKDQQSIVLHPPANIMVNNELALLQLALQGLGLANLFLDDEVLTLLAKGQLIEVLPDWQLASTHYYLYYPNRQFLPAKLRCFIDFFKG